MKTFNSVDSVDNQHDVSYINGNNYRLIADKIHYKIRLYSFICTHAEYDKITDSSVI